MIDIYVLPEVCISLGVIVVAWRYGFEPLRQDVFRCHIRQIRDDLFDFMWQNDLDFQEPAYQEARNSLNGLIHMSGALSPTSIIISVAMAIKRVRDGLISAPSRKSTNPRIQETIDLANQKAANQLLTFLFLQGVFGLVVRGLYWLSCATKAVQRVKQRASEGASYVVANASILVLPKVPLRWTH